MDLVRYWMSLEGPRSTLSALTFKPTQGTVPVSGGRAVWATRFPTVFGSRCTGQLDSNPPTGRAVAAGQSWEVPGRSGGVWGGRG
eukprot:11686633-Alexandrium_andersonii.AAC.1